MEIKEGVWDFGGLKQNEMEPTHQMVCARKRWETNFSVLGDLTARSVPEKRKENDQKRRKRAEK